MRQHNPPRPGGASQFCKNLSLLQSCGDVCRNSIRYPRVISGFQKSSNSSIHTSMLNLSQSSNISSLVLQLLRRPSRVCGSRSSKLQETKNLKCRHFYGNTPLLNSSYLIPPTLITTGLSSAVCVCGRSEPPDLLGQDEGLDPGPSSV